METGRINVYQVVVDLFEKVNNVINLMNANAKDKNISLKHGVNSGQIVFADADMLHAIL